MNPTVRKNLLTHGLIILGFLFLTFLVHYPTFISGESIDQHDVLQGVGGNHQLQEFRNNTGEEPLWNPNMFSGMPAYLTGVHYSGDLLVFVYNLLKLGMAHPPAILFISMLSFYIMLLAFKVRPLIAAAGAITFGLNGFNIIGVMAGHNAKIAAVALMPLALAGIHLTFAGKKWLGCTLTALALGLQIRAGHPQITYYLALIVAAYGINQLLLVIKNKSYKEFGVRAGLLLVAAILAVGANFGRLSTTLEYSKYTIRGKSELTSDQIASSGLDREYAFRYSNGLTEPLFLFVPNIFGGSSQQELSTKSEVAKALQGAGYNRTQIAQQVQSIPTYWGDQPLTAPYYAGTLVVVLFILGMYLLPKEQKVWLIVLAALGIVMSWGKNFESFNDLLFDHLPGYNKFRSVTFTIIITLFSMNLLAFLGLEKLFSTDWSPTIRKKVFWSLGVAGGFLVLLLLGSGALGYRGAVDEQLPEWFVDALRKDRQSLLRKDTLRALMFLVGLIILIWAFFKKNMKSTQVLLGFLFLVFIDSFSLTKRFLGSEKFAKDPVDDFFEMTPADKLLQAATEEGDRVLNLQNPFNENRTSYYHASIGGYHGAKVRRYQDLIDYCLGNEVQEAIQTLQSQSLDFSDLHVLNMLNTTHFYAGAQENGVFTNQSANGAAWIVSNIVTVNSADEEISTVCQINTRQEAVIDQSKFNIPATNGTGTITLIEKTPNKLVYDARISGGSTTALFSEIYYPHGWQVSIDGQEATHLRANYVLRALEIPEGAHQIVFEFKPKSYFLGNTVMLVCSGLILLGFLGVAGVEMKKNVVS